MKNAAIIGATGLVGQQLLRLLLDSDQYTQVHYIGRRRINIDNAKLVQHILGLDALASVQPDANIDDAFCTLGTTIKVAKTEENFAKVDRDYVCAFGEWAKNHGASAMAVNSSVGANPESAGFYLKTKGQMEDCLREKDFKSLIIVRPSLLVPTGRKVTRFAEVLSYRLMQLFGWLMKGKARRFKPVPPLKVAQAMLNGAAQHDAGVTVVESEKI